MSVKGFEKCLIILISIFIGTNTYAQGPVQKLESINLNPEFIQNAIGQDLINNRKIKLNTLKSEAKVIKQKNMSKKFGPLLIGFKANSPRRAAVGFNIDVLETLDILAQKDPSLFLKTDEEHFILSPQTREDVIKTLNILKSKFHNENTITQQKVSSELI